MIRRFAIALGALASPAAAHAQAYQCRVPSALTVPEVRVDGPTRQMPITGYTLAMSWSPEFCKPREDSRAHRVQCSGDNGRFGLVVHGLWPDGARSWPQYCPVTRKITPAEARRNLCMMPSTRLMSHQWAKHGSCMSGKPESYFKITRILWNSLRKPDYDFLSRREGLTAGDIRRAFADANGRHVQPAHVGVKLNSRGWLQELRLCYGKDFMPTRCKPQTWGAKDSARAKIWRGL